MIDYIVVSVTKRGHRKIFIVTKHKVGEMLKYLRTVYPRERHKAYRLEPYREFI